MSVNAIDAKTMQIILKQFPTKEAALKAVNNGTFTEGVDYNQFILELNKPEYREASVAFYGLESANDGDKARPEEERLKNEGAIRARYNAIADELAAAVFSKNKARIDAATSKMQAFKNKYGNFDPTNARQKTEVEAATLKETAKQESRGSTIRVLGDAENSAKDINSHRTAPTTVTEVKSKKQRKQEIKADASYTDKSGVTFRGKKELKGVNKSLEKELDTANKEFKEARKAYLKTDHNKADLALAESAAKLYELSKQKQLAKVAYNTSKGKGVAKRARAQYQNEMSDNRVAQRSHVFRNKKDMEAALKAFPELKGHVSYIDDGTVKFIKSMQQKALAAKEEIGTADSKTQAEYDKRWSSIEKMQVPLPIPECATPEEIKKILVENEKRTRLNQTAMRDIAGDNKIEETEKKTIRNIVNPGKAKGNKLSRTEINNAYKTYGLDYGTRMPGRFRGAGAAALGALPGAAANIALDMLNIKEVFAAAEAHAVAHATATATAEAVAVAVAVATASVPGLSFTEIDKETGEEILKRIVGQEDTQTVEVVKRAFAEVTADEWADVTEKAEAYVKTGGTPDWVGAAIAVGSAALVGFFTSKGEERGVTNGRASKEFKDIEFINLFRTNASKSAASDMLKARDIIAQKTGSVAKANEYLENQFNLGEGIQNHTVTQRELEQIAADFTKFANDFKKPEAPVQEPVEPPVQPSVEEPSVCDEKPKTQNRAIQFTRHGGETWNEIVKAMYPECVEAHGLDEARTALKKAVAEQMGMSWNQFRKLTDIPKSFTYPPVLLGCDINTKGVIVTKSNLGDGKSNDLRSERGYWRAQDGCDSSLMAEGSTKEEALENLAKLKKQQEQK